MDGNHSFQFAKDANTRKYDIQAHGHMDPVSLGMLLTVTVSRILSSQRLIHNVTNNNDNDNLYEIFTGKVHELPPGVL